MQHEKTRVIDCPARQEHVAAAVELNRRSGIRRNS